MSSLKDIRDAVKTTIETNITSLRAYDTVPEAVELPAVVLQPTGSDFDQAMGRGTDRWDFDLIVLVSWGDSDLAQDQLDVYVSGAGTDSIRQTIFQNKTLGLSDVDAHVAGLNEYGVQYQAASIDHLGATLQLIVYTKGTT